jgi:hypothetical protein
MFNTMCASGISPEAPNVRRMFSLKTYNQIDLERPKNDWLDLAVIW